MLIFVCLRYTDRARILNSTRHSPLEMESKDVRFTAEYGVETRVRCKSCYLGMERARKAGFQAFLIYPATIKVSKGHDHNFFNDPAKLDLFLQSHGAKDKSRSSAGNNLDDVVDAVADG